MKKRIARIVGLSVMASLCALGALSALRDGTAMTGVIGGLRLVHEGEEPILYWIFAVGGLIAALVLFVMLWKEIIAFRAWRRFQREGHRFEGFLH